MFDTAINRRNFVHITTLAAGSAWLATHASAEEKSNNAPALPKLPYAFDALEPVIDARTMEIHHGKHHAAYVAGLTTALAGQSDLAGKPLEEIMGSLPAVKEDAIRTALRNHGGGHWNHTFFWEIMAAPKKSEPGAELKKAVDTAFGSLDTMKEKFSEAALKRFGSGWAWLIWQDGKLKITSTANQDNPFMKGLVPDSDLGTPILGLDVWEHAYYLHYQNRRADYIKAWWDVVNWPVVSERFVAMVKA
jgi:superoxide dismutase, Fe-Mn family